MPSEATSPNGSPTSRERDGVGVVTVDPAGLHMHVTPEVRARDVKGRAQPYDLHINQIQRVAFEIA